MMIQAMTIRAVTGRMGMRKHKASELMIWFFTELISCSDTLASCQCYYTRFILHVSVTYDILGVKSKITIIYHFHFHVETRFR
jgi:hypothetical protein